MNDPSSNVVSPAHVLAARLEWMRDRQGRDPQEMLDRQVAFGELSRGQADKVAGDSAPALKKEKKKKEKNLQPRFCP